MTRFVSAQTDADTDLKKFRQTEYAQKPAHKTFNHKFRLATVSCMVAVVVILAIVLPITLNPKQTIPDNGDSLYFLTNEEIEYIEDNIDNFNNENNAFLKDIKCEYIDIDVNKMVDKDNSLNVIGVRLKYFINIYGIESLFGYAYTSNYRLEEKQNDLTRNTAEIGGIEFTYYFNNKNKYIYSFKLDGVEYQMEALCYEDISFEEMINILY